MTYVRSIYDLCPGSKLYTLEILTKSSKKEESYQNYTKDRKKVRNKNHWRTKKEIDPANIYLFKVNNRNTRKKCEICHKLTIKTPEWRKWRRTGVFIVNPEHISHLFLVFLLLTFNK